MQFLHMISPKYFVQNCTACKQQIEPEYCQNPTQYQLNTAQFILKEICLRNGKHINGKLIRKLKFSAVNQQIRKEQELSNPNLT